MKHWKIGILLGAGAIAAIVAVTIFGGAPSDSSPTIQDLLKQEGALNDKCRDGSGDDPNTREACTGRDKIFTTLKTKGWCFGRDGQAEYQKQWQPCRVNAPEQTPTSVGDNDQVQFDPQEAQHKAMLDQMDARANTCFARAIHGLLMNGVRSRDQLLGFAVNTCGQGLNRFLVLQGMPEAAAQAYVRKGAEDVLAVELR